jgi:hypothetical protein
MSSGIFSLPNSEKKLIKRQISLLIINANITSTTKYDFSGFAKIRQNLGA